MLYTTLTYSGTEKTLADWQITNAKRTVRNQATDEITFDLIAAADVAEIFPYGAQITLRIGRAAAGGTYPAGNSTLPMTGATSFSGGTQWFVGYRVQNNRQGSGTAEKLAYKFVGPWEYFFERTVFQKLWFTYNGSSNVADWRSQVLLGLSVNALTGPADTVPGSDATNLMSIAQQLKEIANYCAAISALEQSLNGLGWSTYGGSAQTAIMGYANGLGTSGVPLQFQFDNLSADGSGNYQLLEAPGPACLIPDSLTGYAVSGQTSVTANINTVLRAPLDSVNDITCAEAMRKMLRWIGATGSPVVWFNYATSPPTLNVSTRDQLPSISISAI